MVNPDIVVSSADKDSLWVLPFSMLPIKTPGLQKVRLLKNNHLEGVVEIFNLGGAGSGHIRPNDLRETFAQIDSDDAGIIERLSKLHSYDVYSLRISLREMGIDISTHIPLKIAQNAPLEHH